MKDNIKPALVMVHMALNKLTYKEAEKQMRGSVDITKLKMILSEPYKHMT